MKKIKIYSTKSRIGRLCDKRIRIFKDYEPISPDRKMNLVFTRNEIVDPIDISFTINGIKFSTNHFRLKTYFNEDAEEWTNENIQKIADKEYAYWNSYFFGVYYGIAFEKWDQNERDWIPTLEPIFSCYGRDDVLYKIKEFTKSDDQYTITVEDIYKSVFSVV